MSLKVIFAGTPDFSVAALKALYHSEHDIVAVYTQPDRRAGRGKQLTASPVKAYALEKGLTVVQPQSLKSDEALARLADFNADVMVVTAYGLILPSSVLNSFKYGCINIHASLLPRWRGAAPIQRAIEMGDQQSGVTIMQMDEGLDTGDILQMLSTEIDDKTTGESLHNALMDLGAEGILSVLEQIQSNQLVAQKQNHQLSNYAHKLDKQEGRIDWSKTATDIDRKIRAFYPWPGTFTVLHNKNIKVIQAEAVDEVVEGPVGSVVKHNKHGMLVVCHNSALLIHKLQLPGKKPVWAKDLVHSKNWAGECFAALD